MERSINKLFDSEVDGDDVEDFKFFVKDHNQLYFIVIDNHNNVGHYHPGYITHVEGYFYHCDDNYDDGIFMFSLNSKEGHGIMKYNGKNGTHIFTTLNGGTYYCIDEDRSCGLSDYPYCWVRNSKGKVVLEEK